jgi:hypothetical protein
MSTASSIKKILTILLVIASVKAGAQQALYYQGFEGDPCENWNYNGGMATSGVQRTGNHSGRVGYMSNTLLFSPADVTGYSGLVLRLYHSVKPGPGPGLDTREGAVIQLSLNGGAYVTIGSVSGYSDANWPFTSSSGGSTTGSAGCSIYTMPNPLVVNIPDGTTSVQVKVLSIKAGSCGAFNTAMANATPSLYDRSDEGFYVDDVQITTTTPLPPVTLLSAPGTDNQQQNSCIPLPITDITYTAGDGVINVTGLPAGVSYTYAGGIVTISGSPATDGVYNYTVTNICTDSSATGTIIKTTPLPSTQTTSLSGCNAVVFNGTTYTSSAILNDTVKSYQGCDSVYKVTDITVNTITAVTHTTNISGCNSVVFNGTMYTASIVLHDTLKSYQGCDSVYTITDITVNTITPVTHTTNISGCNSVVFNGTTYTASIVLNDTLKSYQGCDSVYTITDIQVNIITPVTHTTNISGCNSVVFNGTTYTASIVLNDTLKSYQGCDSVYTITDIMVNTIPIITRTTNITGCNHVVFNGITYTTSIVLKDTLKSYQGCDSVYNIANIIVSQVVPVTNTTNLTGCNTVMFNGTAYTSSVILSDTLKSYQGCDSVYNITNIIVTPVVPVTQITNLSGCNMVSFNGTIYTSSAILNDTLKSYQGCDSVYNITNITVTPVVPLAESITLNGCNTVSLNGINYTASTFLKDTLRSYQGCDSIYRTTNIVVNTIVPATQNITLSGCNSVNHNGIHYTVSSTLHDTLRSYQGCDSIYIITSIIVHPVVPVTRSTSISGCNVVGFNGINYTTSTILKDTIPSYQGCDSVYKLTTITVIPVIALPRDSTITGCSKVDFNGRTYTADTEISDTIKTAGGCDSVYHRIHIIVTPGDFVLNLTSSANNINPGVPVTVSTSSLSGYNVIAWQPSSIFLSQSVTTQHIFPDTTMNILVTARSAEGCIGYATLLLTVNQLQDDIYFPSAFNPGSTAGNHLFGPLGRLSLIKNYLLLVYNRWGEVVFASSDPFQKWNGMYKGIPASPGNFVWQASYLYKGTFKKVRKGNIVLVK